MLDLYGDIFPNRVNLHQKDDHPYERFAMAYGRQLQLDPDNVVALTMIKSDLSHAAARLRALNMVPVLKVLAPRDMELPAKYVDALNHGAAVGGGLPSPELSF